MILKSYLLELAKSMAEGAHQARLAAIEEAALSIECGFWQLDAQRRRHCLWGRAKKPPRPWRNAGRKPRRRW